jgi:nucleoside-diphosphate-sugar epimerase
VRRLHGDRRRLAEHATGLKRFAPKVVVDMVPMNERDARGLVETFRGVAERVVAISSQDVYRAYDIMRGLHPGPPDPVPLDEDAPLRERLYPYEREGVEEYEKILVERAVMSEPELPGTVLRLPMVYGPGDYMRRTYPYLKRIDDGRREIPIGEDMARWRWSRGFVEDVAAAIALAAVDDRAAGRVYNVGEADPLPLVGWVRAVVRAAGGGEAIVVPDELLPEHLGMDLNAEQDLVTDTGRIRRELGFREEVSREEAIRRTVEWERANPPEKVNPGEFDYAAEDAALALLEGRDAASVRRRVL